MILLVGLLLAALAVPVLGGSFGRLSDVHFRASWTLLVAFGLQGVIGIVTGIGEGLAGGLHVASYAVLGGFLWVNRDIPGMRVVALGTALNVVAIVANGGVMPASPAALETAGIEADVDGFRNSDVVDEPKLAFLGDVFALPDSWPFANVFSIGDAVVLLGGALGLHQLTGSRLGSWPSRPPRRSR